MVAPVRAASRSMLDEMAAVRRALDRSRPGDLVVLCVDYATEVYKEIEQRRGVASPDVLRASEGDLADAVGGDPDLMRRARLDVDIAAIRSELQTQSRRAGDRAGRPHHRDPRPRRHDRVRQAGG